MKNAQNISFQSIQAGDKKAFELIFRSLYKQLVNYAFRLIRNQEDAEEIVQQIFLSIWEKRADLSIEGALENYLYRATKNRCINFLKLELPKRQNQEDIENVKHLTSNQQEDTNQQKELSKKINNAIDELPKKCKEVFLLSRYGGLTYAEIAEELTISIKTVENQMSIALKKLRESLKDIANIN